MTMARVETAATMPSAARAHFMASSAVASRFFGEHAEGIARACHSMAARFQQGGRLLVCGDGAQRSDVSHVVVEFLHPVVVGKRALPAIALAGDTLRDGALHLAVFARQEDILLVLSAGPVSPMQGESIVSAAALGLLTVVLSGGDALPPSGDHAFMVPSNDGCIVQETHEMLYHVLWELTHVFLDHRGGES